MRNDMVDDSQIDIMTAMMKGQVALEEPEMIKAELGYGKGLGNKFGTYKQYIATASLRNVENPVIYIGKDIKEENNIISIVSPGNEFNESETPIVLLEYRDILYGFDVRLHWMGSSLDSWSMFEIPSPISQLNTRWWDLYFAWFYAPERLISGEYKIELFSTELKKGVKTVMDELYFNII